MIRAAVYCRYSSDKQSDLSTEDQLRFLKEYAAKNGLTVLPEHCYMDQAVSGARAANRDGLQALLKAARRKLKPFDVVLTEKTSRSARDVADMFTIRRELDFLNIDTIWVSDGFKSTDENADMLLMMAALKDAGLLKDISKQTHRGLSSQILRGFSGGGRCYGYSYIPTGADSKRMDVRMEVNEAEAAVLNNMFELYVAGLSYKGICRKLTAEGIQPPRSHDGRMAGWYPAAVREMLRNELYTGVVIWNRTRWIKSPDGRRVSRRRPESEWLRLPRPELRIIPDELWHAAQQQLARRREHYARSGGRYGNLYGEGRGAEHLLTGILKCDVCGGSMTIVSGYGAGRIPRYGCTNRAHSQSCSNDLRELESAIEERLFTPLLELILSQFDYAVEEVRRQVEGEAGQHYGQSGCRPPAASRA
jgi:DNA invertase Pin-like site-specific DNA recombinase